MRRSWKYLTTLVVIASVLWLTYKLYTDWQIILTSITNLFSTQPYVVPILLLLTITGIMIDAIRWKCMIGDTDNKNLLPHIKTVITSITYSNFSVLGIGEHVARINTNETRKSNKTILTDSVIISILNTITIPLVAMPFLALDYTDPLKIVDIEGALLIFITLPFILFILSLFKNKWTDDIKLKRIIPAFLFTAVKTLFFFFQFFILLHCLLPDITPYQLWCLTCSYYFVITLIPLSNGISNMAVRTGVISIIFFKSADSSIAISAVIIMWLLNVVLVSLSYFSYKTITTYLHKK
ncbi:MAG: hypothetical protein MJZ18_01465 [Bacteroidales bacterium]|nr:hypothetical protein [Bacteroidales bacterium]